MVDNTSDDMSKELVSAIVLIHNKKRDSFWYRFHDHKEDIPDSLPKIKDNPIKDK